jgi:hypothetical protein
VIHPVCYFERALKPIQQLPGLSSISGRRKMQPDEITDFKLDFLVGSVIDSLVSLLFLFLRGLLFLIDAHHSLQQVQFIGFGVNRFGQATELDLALTPNPAAKLDHGHITQNTGNSEYPSERLYQTRCVKSTFSNIAFQFVCLPFITVAMVFLRNFNKSFSLSICLVKTSSARSQTQRTWSRKAQKRCYCPGHSIRLLGIRVDFFVS